MTKIGISPRLFHPEPGAPPGYLLYIKPTLYGTEPVDILSYAAESESFPHESTSDQWFSESQLESYRALGAYILDRIWECGGDRPPGGLTDFIKRAESHGGLTGKMSTSKTSAGQTNPPAPAHSSE